MSLAEPSKRIALARFFVLACSQQCQPENFRPNSRSFQGTILRFSAPNDGRFLPSDSQNFCYFDQCAIELSCLGRTDCPRFPAVSSERKQGETKAADDLHSLIQFQSINRHLIPRTNSPQGSNPALLFLLGRQILLKRFVAILRLSLIATSNTRIKNARRIDLLVYPNNHDLLSQLT